jgi:hypothetical protein
MVQGPPKSLSLKKAADLKDAWKGGEISND